MKTTTEEEKREQARIRMARWRANNPDKQKLLAENQAARLKKMRETFRELEKENGSN